MSEPKDLYKWTQRKFWALIGCVVVFQLSILGTFVAVAVHFIRKLW